MDASAIIPVFILSCIVVIALIISSVIRGKSINAAALRTYILIIVGGVCVGVAIALAFSFLQQL